MKLLVDINSGLLTLKAKNFGLLKGWNPVGPSLRRRAWWTAPSPSLLLLLPPTGSAALAAAAGAAAGAGTAPPKNELHPKF